MSEGAQNGTATAGEHMNTAAADAGRMNTAPDKASASDAGQTKGAHDSTGRSEDAGTAVPDPHPATATDAGSADRSTPTDAGTANTDPDACKPGPAGADLVYSWTYQTIISNDSHGNPLTTSVSGNLTLRNDASYEQDLYIGDVLNYSTGTYEVCGERIVFHTDDGEDLDFDFTVGTQDGRTAFVYQSPDPLIYGLELEACGDNACSAGETANDCPNDCGSCGDKLCASSETAPECADCVH